MTSEGCSLKKQNIRMVGQISRRCRRRSLSTSMKALGALITRGELRAFHAPGLPVEA